MLEFIPCSMVQSMEAIRPCNAGSGKSNILNSLCLFLKLPMIKKKTQLQTCVVMMNWQTELNHMACVTNLAVNSDNTQFKT